MLSLGSVLLANVQYVLRFDGRGNYEYKKMEDCEEEFGS